MQPIMAAMLSCQGTFLSNEEKNLFKRCNPLGISLFTRNLENPKQIYALVSSIKETVGRNDILIALDQEGGRVRRLVEPYFRSYAANITLGQLPFIKAQLAAKLQATLISYDMQKLGINMNYAPVLDLAYPNTSLVLKSRCFSDNKTLVAQLGKIMLDEYLKNGIIPCIKHLPGHGRAVVDPHLFLPIIDESLDELTDDFYPFQFNRHTPFGMTAHIIINAVDKLNPITQSAIGINKIIRQQIGFDGFLLSDAIDMRALQGTISEKTTQSLQAGCDAICYCFGKLEEMQKIAEICPTLSKAAEHRLANATKFLNTTPNQFDNIEELAIQYQSLIGSIPSYEENYDATEILHTMQERNTSC